MTNIQLKAVAMVFSIMSIATTLEAQNIINEHLFEAELCWMPYSVSTGDLNGDNFNDVISIHRNYYNDTVLSWYENNGGMDFEFQQTISGHMSGLIDIAVGDLDGDMDEDIVGQSLYNNEVFYMENIGAGVFTMHVISDTLEGARSVEVGDLDGDGDLDVVAIDGVGIHQLVWFENDGSGTFVNEHILSNNSMDDHYEVEVGDVDGDGDLDLMTYYESSWKVTWYSNDGVGNFTAQNIITTSMGNILDIKMTDADNDGDMDVAISNIDRVQVWMNTGVSTFTPGDILYSTDPIDVLHIRDMNNDGNEDVVFGTKYMLNDGTGDYGTVLYYATNIYGWTDVCVEDLNNDGIQDVGIASYTLDRIMVFDRPSLGAPFGDPVILSSQVLQWSDEFDNVDFDQDGDIDIISASRDNTFDTDRDDDLSLSIYENTGNGLFASQRILKNNIEQGGYALEVVAGYEEMDYDDDGDLDFLYISEGHLFGDELFWIENLGSWNFAHPASLTTWEDVWDVKVGDMDNDGMKDLIIAKDPQSGSGDQLYLLKNLGGGSYGAPITIENDNSYVWGNYSIVDVNMDGELDIVNYSTSQIVWYENQGSGNSFTRTTVNNSFNYPRSVTVADYDNDGDNDIVARSSTSHVLIWHENIGGSVFSPADTILNSFETHFYLRDMNGDQVLDLLYADNDSLMWQNNLGGTNLGTKKLLKNVVGPLDIKFSDLNSDGYQDIIIEEFENRKMYWLEMCYDMVQTIHDTICQGDSYFFDGQNLTTSGTYIETSTNVHGCSSSTTLILQVSPATSNSISYTSCDSLVSPSGLYTWFSSGTYMDTIVNSGGCDSVITINLTINNSPAVSISGLGSSYLLSDPGVTISGSPVGGVFSGNGVTGNIFDPSVAGVGTHTIIYSYSANGCIGMDSVIVTVQSISCDSYATNSADSRVENVTLVGESNTINQTSPNNCQTYTDYTSVTPADLGVGNTYDLLVTQGTCNGNYTRYCNAWIDFNQDGDFDDVGEMIGTGTTSSNTPGYVHTLSFTVPSGAQLGTTVMRVIVKESSQATNPCDIYTYGETEDYLIEIIPAPLCDSYATNSADSRIDNVTLVGESITINQSSPNSCQTYTDYTSVSPSDIRQGNGYSLDVTQGTCNGDYTRYCSAWIDFNQDNDFDDPGEMINSGTLSSNVTGYTYQIGFTVPVSAMIGNTTMRVIVKENGATTDPCATYSYGETEDYKVTILPCIPTTSTDVISACGSYTWIDGITYTTSNNTATYTTTGVGGCDSIVSLELTLGQPTTGVDVQSACSTFTWIDGNTYTTDNNTATYVLTNAVGCDSTVMLDLTIESTSEVDVISACGSYTWIDGITYSTSNNTASMTYSNIAGCDSTVLLDLTISQPTSFTDIISSCGPYTWIDGNTYSSNNNSATYVLNTVAGCDSIVTLDLTINSTSVGTDVISACDSYSWIDGNTYTSSNNTAMYTLTNAVGCDSVVTLDLSLNNSSSFIDAIASCGSYTWIDGNTYTTSNNTATYILTNSVGCDSIISLDLTIPSIDIGVSQNGIQLTSSSSTGTYQWLDCDNNYSPIAGAVNQTFTPEYPGNYAALVEENGCSDTTACYNITNVLVLSQGYDGMSIYPNPNNGHFIIDLGSNNIAERIEISNALGEIVEVIRIDSQISEVNLEEEAGVYFVNINNNVFRIVLM